MYDEKVRNMAVSLVQEGYSPREVSEILGGKPGHAIIRRWANGYVPAGKRRRSQFYSAQEKLAALERVANGEYYRDVADELGCNPSTLLQWKRLYAEEGADGLRSRIDRYVEHHNLSAAS